MNQTSEMRKGDKGHYAREKAILVSIVLMVFVPQVCGDSQRGSTTIHLWGQATGGILEMVSVRPGLDRTLSIETAPGESAEHVISRLAERILASNVIYSSTPSLSSVRAEGNALTLEAKLDTNIALRGSEKGLGIPAPPEEFTCNIDLKAPRTVFRWKVPPGEKYDRVFIAVNGVPAGPRSAGGFDGSKTEVTVGGDLFGGSTEPIETVYCTLVARRNGTPSDVARCSVTTRQCIRDWMDGEYVDHVAPGWQRWTDRRSSGEIVYVEGTRQGYHGLGRAGDMVDGDYQGKTKYQILVGKGAGDKPFVGGVYKKFTGLVPGHVYEIEARVNISKELEESNNNWCVSLNAAANPPDGGDITVEQMGGTKEIPIMKGALPAGGQIVLFEQGRPEKENAGWREVISTKPGPGNLLADRLIDIKDSPWREGGRIWLPEGSTSLTVWVKYEGTVSDQAIALDAVTIRDVTPLRWDWDPPED